jgi:hypothetical protein
VCADIETALDSLPAVGGSWRPPLFDLAVRGRGTNGPEAHIAYPAQNDWERRPHVRLWGAPNSDPDLSTYSSRHERLDDTHTRFEATVPLALLGVDADCIVVQCCHYSGRSAEPFVKGLDLDERHLVEGARITGETVLRFE